MSCPTSPLQKLDADHAVRQAAAGKQRRQERDAFLKQQAESRKAELKPTSEVKKASIAETADVPTEAAQPAQVSEPTRKRKLDTPNLLPLELLESEDEEDDEAGRKEELSASQPKKINGVKRFTTRTRSDSSLRPASSSSSSSDSRSSRGAEFGVSSSPNTSSVARTSAVTAISASDVQLHCSGLRLRHPLPPPLLPQPS